MGRQARWYRTDMGKIRNIAVAIARIAATAAIMLSAVSMIGATEAFADDVASNGNKNEYTSNYMTDIDFYELSGGATGTDSGSSSSIASGGASVLKVIVNGVLLPAAILVAAWKIIYIAIFPLMMRNDPLGMVSHVQYGDFRNMRYQKMASMMHAGRKRKSDLDSPYDIVHQHLLPEVKKFGISCGIIALVWIGLQFVIDRKSTRTPVT